MKTVTVFMLVIALSICCTVNEISASETRVFSMGQTGQFTYDNSNIVFFPGAVMRYQSEIVTELRLKNTERTFSAEVRLPVNSYVLGLNFNRPISFSNPGIGTNINLNETSDFYFGTALGDNSLGIRVSLGRDGFNQDSTAFTQKIDESARYLEIAGGLSSDYWDAGVSVELPSVTSEVGSGKDEWSGFGVNAIGRYFYDASADMQYVPVVRFGLSSSSRTTDLGTGQPSQDTDYSGLNFSIGAGLRYELNEDNLIIVAVDPFGYSSSKTDVKDGTETTVTTTTLPRLYLGAETTLKGWLYGRIGANRAYQTRKTKVKPAVGDERESSFQSSAYNVTFGLGIKIGKFLVDVDINDELLFEGPNFISGQTSDMANRISVSYLFSNSERRLR